MPNPFDVSPEVKITELVLERHKVANRAAIGPQVMHDMKIETYMEHMLDRMIVQLRSHVYAHKVDVQDVTVPFSKTETFKFSPPRRLLWTYGLVVLLGMVLTLAAESWPALVVTCAAALAWVVVYAGNPPREETVTVKGEAVVHREQFNSFPDNQTVYPDSLGAPVRMASMESWPRYLDD